MRSPSILQQFLRTAVAPLFLALGTQAEGAVIVAPDSDSVLLWHLNESSGSSFADASANLFTGGGVNVGTGQVMPGAEGVLGNGVQFGGTTATNLIRATSVQSVYTGGDFTLQLWMKTPSTAGADSTLGRLLAIIRTGPTQNLVGFSLGVSANGSLKLFSNSTQNSTTLNQSTAALSWAADTWYNLSLVSTTAGAPEGQAHYTLYRTADGAGTLGKLLDFTAGAVAMSTTVSGNFMIGADQAFGGSASRSYIGLMDEVHFSKVARTESYLMASIPEPSTWAITGVGLLVVMARRHRKRS